MDKTAMYDISYGLYVLTAKNGDKDNGCIVNTFMQVTSEPNVVVMGVNKQNFTCEMIAQTRKFNISMLTENAKFEQFMQFGFQSGRNVDKFAGQEIKRSTNGIAYIEDNVNAYLSCNVVDMTDFGTHMLFKAEVEDGVTFNRDKSLTYAYYQSNIKPKPQKVKKTVFRCRICGYEYVGETLSDDFICPICKHGASDFEKIVVE